MTQIPHATRQWVEDNPPAPTAAEVPYDHTTSGLSATNVKAALDELKADIGTGGGGGGASDAADVTYDNTSSGMSATTVQQALDELKTDVGMVTAGSGLQPLDYAPTISASQSATFGSLTLGQPLPIIPDSGSKTFAINGYDAYYNDLENGYFYFATPGLWTAHWMVAVDGLVPGDVVVITGPNGNSVSFPVANGQTSVTATFEEAMSIETVPTGFYFGTFTVFSEQTGVEVTNQEVTISLRAVEGGSARTAPTDMRPPSPTGATTSSPSAGTIELTWPDATSLAAGQIWELYAVHANRFDGSAFTNQDTGDNSSSTVTLAGFAAGTYLVYIVVYDPTANYARSLYVDSVTVS